MGLGWVSELVCGLEFKIGSNGNVVGIELLSTVIGIGLVLVFGPIGHEDGGYVRNECC